MRKPVIDLIFDIFQKRGSDAYLGEQVTQLEHALQSGWAAERNGEPADVIVAALLHDIGHLLHGLPYDCAEHGVDDEHEELGFRFLAKHFGPVIAEMVRLHVPAKRYLTATDPGYRAILSPTSQRSLTLQGGEFSPAEVAEFNRNPHCAKALAVRRYDDIAKEPGLKTPDLPYFRTYLEQTIAAGH